MLNENSVDESQDEVSTVKESDVKTEAEIDPQRLTNVPLKVALLQEKAKNVRDKLVWGRRTLEQKQMHVKQSPAERNTNDELAAQAITACVSNSKIEPCRSSCNQNQVNVDVPLTISTGTVIGASRPQVLTNDAAPKQRTRQRKPRRVLQDQIDGLKELLVQLTRNNPQFQAQAQQLAFKNPNLRDLELFPSNVGQHETQPPNNHQAGKQRYYSEPVRRKVRHESELSNTSICISPLYYESLPETDTKINTKKKRNKVKKNKSKDLTKTQASEQKALADYINKIVGEYLDQHQDERIFELEFKGGVEDLEQHAQRLVQAGLGRIVEVEIRINRKNNRQAFVAICNDREGSERDGIILMPVARRYAFEGDVVRAFVLNAGVALVNTNNAAATPVPINKASTEKDQNKESAKYTFSFSLGNDEEDPFATEDSDMEVTELDTSIPIASDNCPKAFVIKIVKQTELRQIVGTIAFKNPIKLHDESQFYKLKPHDMRVPMVYIPVESCVAHVTEENKKDVCGLLYVAHVLETDINGNCIAELVQPIGKVGNMEAEIKAILLHNNLKDIQPYEERFNNLYALPEAPIKAEDHPHREDLRSKCIFTIDPLTARDLDDAMSIEQIGDEEVEVGVHISDVSHYLKEDSELDNIVKDRATSIYLVNEVIHMLPQPLCYKCSLLPDEEKFAFSVFWRMTRDGRLLAPPRFTRSIIKSCSQFAYEHAQKIIDNPQEEFNKDDDFPTICNGFTPSDIVERVRLLHNIARHMREERYENGALSINNPKLRFILDPLTGEPIGYSVEGRQEANFLIEEFMLLANQSVAKFIHDHFPNISILRNHAPPLSKSMKALKEKLAHFGIMFDHSSSKAIYESMQRICRESSDPAAMDACLNTLLTKPMARAQYFCSDGKTEESELWHYALSIPIYTHFTSPIRRYPDILVHRLLAAALGYCAPPKRTIDELHYMAKVCNVQKLNAKNAGDESNMLFFKRFIESKQSIVLRAVVTEIFQHNANVITISTGHAISINYKMQKVLVDTANAPAYILISENNSKIAPIKLQMFSTIDVKLVVWDNKLCGYFASPDPKQRQINYTNKQRPSQQVNANASGNGNDVKISTGAIRKIPQSSQNENAKKKKDKQKTTNDQSKTKALRTYALCADKEDKPTTS